MDKKFNIPKGTKLIEKQRNDGSIEYTVRRDKDYGNIEGKTYYLYYFFYLLFFLVLAALFL